MPEAACLHIQTRDTEPVRVVELSGVLVRVGRASFCEIRLSDAGVAEEVCHLRRRGSSWHLVPVASPGTVSIEGRAVDKSRLLPFGVSFRVGESWLTLRPNVASPPEWGNAQAPLTVDVAVVREPTSEAFRESPRPAAPTSAAAARATFGTGGLGGESDADHLSGWKARKAKREGRVQATQDDQPWEARWRALGERLRSGAEAPAVPATPAQRPAEWEKVDVPKRQTGNTHASTRRPGPSSKRVPRPAPTPPGYPSVQPVDPPTARAGNDHPPFRGAPATAPSHELVPFRSPLAEPLPIPLIPAELPSVAYRPVSAPPKTSEFRDPVTIAPEPTRSVDLDASAPVYPSSTGPADDAPVDLQELARPEIKVPEELPTVVETAETVIQAGADAEPGPEEGVDQGLEVVGEGLAEPVFTQARHAHVARFFLVNPLPSNEPQPSLSDPEACLDAREALLVEPLASVKQVASQGEPSTDETPDVNEQPQGRNAQDVSFKRSENLDSKVGRAGHSRGAATRRSRPAREAPRPAPVEPAKKTAPSTGEAGFRQAAVEAQPRPLPESLDGPRERRSGGEAPSQEWPSARDILAAHGVNRPRDQAPTRKRTVAAPPIGPVPSVHQVPDHWSLPLWAGWLPLVLVTISTGVIGIALSWTWSFDAKAADLAADLLAARKPGAQGTVDLELAPGMSWWQTSSGTLSRWGTAIARIPGDQSRVDASSFIDSAATATTFDSSARYVLARAESPGGAQTPLARSLGLSRDVVSLAWSGHQLFKAGKRDAALKAYRSALELAARVELSRLGSPVVLEEDQVQRFALPGEHLIGVVLRDMISHTEWSYADWSGALPETSVPYVVAARLLREHARADSDAALDAVAAHTKGAAQAGPRGAIQVAALAEAYVLRADWTNAEATYKEAIERMPVEVARRSWWFNLADVERHLNNDRKRQEALEAAKSTAQSDEITRHALELQKGSGYRTDQVAARKKGIAKDATP